MPQPRNKQELLERETRAWSLRCRGWTEQAIAEDLGLTQQAVSAILKRVAGRKYAALEESVKEQKVTQLEQLDYLQHQAMEGWERSIEDAETERTRTKRLGVSDKRGGGRGRPDEDEDEDAEVSGMYLDEDGEEVSSEERARMIARAAVERARGDAEDPLLSVVEEVTVKESKGQAGDPRFLEQAQRALAAKREILGINAPKKQEVSGPEGGPIEVSTAEMKQAEAELAEWRKQMQEKASSMPSPVQTPPTSATPTG